MESDATKGPKKLRRRARFDADVLNRTKILQEDPSSPLFRFSHGYVLSRSPILAVLTTSILTALITFFVLMVIDHFEFGAKATDFYFLGFKTYHDTIRGVYVVTSMITVDYVLLLRGVEANKRWLISFFTVVFGATALILFFHWNF